MKTLKKGIKSKIKTIDNISDDYTYKETNWKLVEINKVNGFGNHRGCPLYAYDTQLKIKSKNKIMNVILSRETILEIININKK